MKFKLTLALLLACSSALFALETQSYKVGDNAKLTLANVSGDIRVEGGSNGVIEIDYTKRDDRIEVTITQNGDHVDVQVEYPRGEHRIKGGVDFDIRFPGNGTLDLKSVSGDVNVLGVEGDLNLQSVSGDVILSETSGKLDLASVSGSVNVSKVGLAQLDATSISGSVSYSEGDLEGGDYEFSSTSGRISIKHGPNAAYTVSGRTISGSVDNNAGGNIQVERAKYSGIKSISGSRNGGGAEVEINTVSGSIILSAE